jgi:hypothetical protein
MPIPVRRRHFFYPLAFTLIGLSVAAPAAHAAVVQPPPPPPPAATSYFVVGDLSANVGSSVQFWGAQWWKDNTLSGGAAPASFKGFADTVDNPSCPAEWSTDPGNSPPPPDTVPSQMTLLVTSSVQKSGSVISGNVVEMVTVQTDPGYQGDPGHPGFGTVTGIVTCGSVVNT